MEEKPMMYGCIGEHLGHSFSREIHAKLAGYDYELKEIAPENLGAFMTEKAFAAINVTIPYKKAVIPYLSEISDRAKAIGAVNTIVNRDGKLCGYNTDFFGMTALAEKAGIDIQGKKVLILGTGGTSLTAAAVAEAMRAREIFKVSRTGRDGAITYEDALAHHTDAEILINTTPVGMFPGGGIPIAPEAFPHLSGVLDAVYNPLRTELVRRAAKMGVPAAGGLYMLVMQAVRAYEIFTGEQCAPEKAEAVYRETAAAKENIVLIGMPGSGKSTVGKLLAAKLGRPFIDTDKRIVEKAGREIPAIFEEIGESGFRDMESAVIAEVAKETGAVIATGGGAILRPENLDALRANGRIFFRDRPLENLKATASRPLSSTREALAALYEARLPLYRAAADEIISDTDSAEDAAGRIERSFLP